MTTLLCGPLAGPLVYLIQLEKVEQFSDFVAELLAMAHLDPSVDEIAVSSSDPFARDVAALDQITHDPLRRSLGDPDHFRNVTQPHIRVSGDREQDLRVVGDEPPRLLGVVACLP